MEHARLDHDVDLVVKYRNVESEVWQALLPRDLNQADEGVARRRNLSDLSSTLRNCLGNGQLVIVQDEGASLFFNHNESAERFQRLCDIVDKVPDRAKRVELLRQVVSDGQMAEAIADNFIAPK